jgi:glycosyltransferase involved in cell wall biosynthesis
MAKDNLRVCIVMPAYNEAPIIESVLKALPTNSTFAGATCSYDLVVVDDGSHDGTADKARKVARAIVLRHIINLGAGAATRTGLHYAAKHQYDLVLSVDADGQHAPEDIPKMVEYMYKNPDVDLLIGSRLKDNGDMSPLIKLGNVGLSYITLLLLGTYVSDSQSGMRAFSRQALKRMRYNSNNYAFCSEMIWQAKRAGLKVAECPIKAIYTDYSRTKESGQKTFSAALKILQQLVSRRFIDLIS